MENVIDVIHLEFVKPEFFSLLIWTLLFVLGAGLLAFKVRYNWLKKVSPMLSFETLGKMRLKSHFLVLILSLIVIAGLGLLTMEGRLFRNKEVPDYEKLYINIWFDVSKSSLAEDIERGTGDGSEKIKISRLNYQKQEILNLVSRLKGDWVSLGVFAGKGYLLIHPTEVTEERKGEILGIFREELYRLNAEMLQNIPQGTNLGVAIYNGALSDRGPESPFGTKPPDRIVIILTDGEKQGQTEVLTKDLDTALKAAREVSGDTTFYIVGVGNPYKGALIPAPTSSGLKYEVNDEGEFIRTQPDWYFLTSVAQRLEGTFIPARSGDELVRALKQILIKERKIIARKKVEREETQFFRVIAITCLCLLVVIYYQES